MLVQIPALLPLDQLAAVRELIDRADWIDGNATSGHQSAGVKDNLQLPEASAAAAAAGAIVRAALDKNPLFVSAALPANIYPPLFNRYGRGQGFGNHIDNAIRRRAGTDFRIRTDLSATLFLTDPAEYDGGELVVEDTYGAHQVKLAAGDMILYPASSLHRVTPVTRGMRTACFFWVQSLVRDDGQRTLLFDMDLAIRGLTTKLGGQDAGVVSLTGAYHNLLRMWSQV